MLSIQNLHANVSDKPILKGVTLDVPAGQAAAIMGANGVGRSRPNCGMIRATQEA